MFKGLQPILYGGREVWPLIEGGKGVSATNHASSGAWAAAGGIGTVSAAGTFFVPFANLHTGALTVDNVGTTWVDMGGSIIVPPGYFASVAASATASTTVASISLLYGELPI